MEDPASELRLFVQAICCDYLVFHHLDEGVGPEEIRIRQEVALGAGVFADIEVQAGTAAPYFVEVKWGYSRERLFESLRRTHMGVVGDSINLAARLNDVAGCDEVVVSNTLYQRLPDAARADFLELAPVEAKNIGRIRAWRRGPPRAPLA